MLDSRGTAGINIAHPKPLCSPPVIRRYLAITHANNLCTKIPKYSAGSPKTTPENIAKTSAWTITPPGTYIQISAGHTHI